MVISTRRSWPDKEDKLVAIWCRPVDTACDFLLKAYRKELEEVVRVFLPEAPLWVAASTQDQPIASMLFTGEHMGALLVNPSIRGYGVGKLLIEHALSLTSKLTTNVNGRNEQAVGFYRRMSFNVTGCSETDDLGQPYPLLSLIYEQQAEAD